MKQVIIEYSATAIAVIGAMGFFIMLGYAFLGREGMFATIVSMVLGGL